MDTSLNLNVTGTELAVSVDTPVLHFEAGDANVRLEVAASPTLEVSVVEPNLRLDLSTPQILLPINEAGVPGPPGVQGPAGPGGPLPQSPTSGTFVPPAAGGAGIINCSEAPWWALPGGNGFYLDNATNQVLGYYRVVSVSGTTISFDSWKPV